MISTSYLDFLLEIHGEEELVIRKYDKHDDFLSFLLLWQHSFCTCVWIFHVKTRVVLRLVEVETM